jgi:hypothetical protein
MTPQGAVQRALLPLRAAQRALRPLRAAQRALRPLRAAQRAERVFFLPPQMSLALWTLRRAERLLQPV